MKSELYNILRVLDESMHKSFIEEAQSSIYRVYYPKLEHDLSKISYFGNNESVNKISTIFKTRGELLPLNFIPHRPDLPIQCSMCNLNTREDIMHFVGICPLLKEIRKLYLGKAIFTTEEVIYLLNGNDWSALFKFVKSALRYRNQILREAF